MQLLEFDEIDSTNQEALRRVVAGDKGPLWILANRQTGGRGRRGRTWISEDGNFFASFLDTTGCDIADAAQISFVAGIALFDAVNDLFWLNRKPSNLMLKWPNDLLLDGKKLAGILTECTPGRRLQEHMQPETAFVIGIGLNLTTSPDLPDRPAIALSDCRLEIQPQELLQPLAGHLDRWLGIWNEGRDIATVLEEWQKRAMKPGTEISVHTGHDEVISGKIAGLSPRGELRVETFGEVRTISFGDVEALEGDPDNMQNGK